MKGKYQKKRHGRKAVFIILALLALAAGASVLLRQDPAMPPAPSTEPSPAGLTTPPDTVPTETEPTEPVDPIARQAEAILETMTLDEKIYQLFIVTQEQLTGVSTVTQSGPATQAAIEQQPVGGIIYFASNLVSRDQVSAMISGVQSYSRLGLFIAVDEEGGAVARLGRNSAMGTTSFPAMGTIGASGDPSKAYDAGYTIGTDIAALGFNLDFAPVADVNSNPDNPIIGTRAFHSDPETAAEMVAACVEGFNDSGVLCTLKHFPGHGDTGTDSHLGTAEISKTLEELTRCELLPFASGIDAGAPFIMVGHITLPNVTAEPVPATLSPEIVTGLLRQTMGYEGLIVTDSMVMGAITDHYAPGEAAVLALLAGVDVILIPQDLTQAVTGIRDAIEAGTLTEGRIDESVLRILEAKLRSDIIGMP